jgi:hypothetical protein
MIDQILVLMVIGVYIFLIVRTVLVLTGWFKSVALRTFEQYGNERPFRPISDLVFRIVFLILLLQFLGMPPSVKFVAFFLGGVMLLGGLDTFQDALVGLLRRVAPKYGELYVALIAYYPVWYRDLASRTSRYERRRIAYMWLRLSPHQRFLLDRDTPTFLHWTDFVIMGSVMEEDLGTKPIPKTHERGYFN